MTKITRTYEEIQIESESRNNQECAEITMIISHHTGEIEINTAHDECVRFNCSLEKAQNIARAINAGLKYAKKSMGAKA